MKKGLLPEPSDLVRQHVVVLCGDILLHRKPLSDSASRAAGLTVSRCPEDQQQAISRCHQLNASLFVATQAFIEQLPTTDLVQLTNYTKGRYILAILESDTLETAPAAKMLRLGCRGVLPRTFTSKILRRAVLAVLGRELWAPRGVISELLSDLLRAASLMAEKGLTPQEARIFELSLKGYSNSAIADALSIRQETVRWHKRRLNRKLLGPNRYPQANATPSSRGTASG